VDFTTSLPTCRIETIVDAKGSVPRLPAWRNAIYNPDMLRRSHSPSALERLRAIVHLWSARTHRHYGIVYGDRQEFVDAVDEYTHALGLNPALQRGYLERGILFWRELNHPRRAIADLTAALDLQPGWPEALFCRGLAYEAAGEFSAAIRDLSDYLVSNDRAWRESAQTQLELLRSMVGEALPGGDPP
jgi:tetratricopeptide (TPR) repeat protein